MASNLQAMASNLLAMASIQIAFEDCGYFTTSLHGLLLEMPAQQGSEFAIGSSVVIQQLFNGKDASYMINYMAYRANEGL